MKGQARKRRVPRITAAEEARIQAGFAADPDNPEWTAQDFKRAKPFRQAFPALAKTRAPAAVPRRNPKAAGL